jgi:hypothetical protein
MQIPFINGLFKNYNQKGMFDFWSTWMTGQVNALGINQLANGVNNKKSTNQSIPYRVIEKETLDAIATSSALDASAFGLRHANCECNDDCSKSSGYKNIECSFKSLEAASIALRVAHSLDSRLRDNKDVNAFYDYLSKVEQCGLSNERLLFSIDRILTFTFIKLYIIKFL